jgi:phosphonate transport system substrate-binding protein
VRAYLAEIGELGGFFGSVIESGAHTKSIELILSGAIDGAAIDSTVLEWLSSQRADLDDQLRVIHTMGPSPIPPWVISTRLPQMLRSQVRRLLLDLPSNPLGRGALVGAQIATFTFADDRDYDAIRRMARKAEPVLLA